MLKHHLDIGIQSLQISSEHRQILFFRTSVEDNQLCTLDHIADNGLHVVQINSKGTCINHSHDLINLPSSWHIHAENCIRVPHAVVFHKNPLRFVNILAVLKKICRQFLFFIQCHRIDLAGQCCLLIKFNFAFLA